MHTAFAVNISDRQAWESSVDPDQTPQMRRLIRIYTVCQAVNKMDVQILGQVW